MKDISNSRLTLLRKLNRRKYREQERLFVIEGARAVEQIIHNGKVEIAELFFDKSQNYWDQPEWDEKANYYPTSSIDRGYFQEISDTDSPQGVLALCRMPPESPVAELIEETGILLATDRIQDPGNLGTMIRTAVWFGASGLLSGKGTVDLFHPKVVRSTAGATGSLNHCNLELQNGLKEFENHGWQVLILDGGEGSRDIREIKTSEKTILLTGNEANGADPQLFSEHRIPLRIESAPGQKEVESLNAAIATAIALFAIRS
ncbi:RNA methyltransferase [Balneolaceae bacterium YR4-1]|uniref:RNA methyltransferase n=1 Tax=Halalkalibaculum roseum TaxID=2709311 RepID=A0A6M1T1R2_9BACT|nr:RNA methyltransferase [Halalkalibaculum roseum]NGP78056.1 RNA methyltransferase [Halalkalibaculum roseum]